MSAFERICAMSAHGFIPPASYLKSNAQSKIVLWRALAEGGRLNKHSAAAIVGWHLTTADEAISELHAAGLVHIVGWTRNGDRGPMTKVVAFGPGKDLPRPKRLSNAFVCKRWRCRNPEKAARSDRNFQAKCKAKEGRLPKGNDPLLFAIMGIK